MKIKIYTISKKADSCEDYIKMIKGFGVEMEVLNLSNAKIQNAQKISAEIAQNAYQSEFEKYLNENSFALDSHGKEVDSLGFSEIMRDKLARGKNSVNFFVGGAYGFGADFLAKTTNLSLSKLTFSHKIVPLILCEQIYRAFCIINNHPYHK